MRRVSGANQLDFDISIGTAKFNSELKFSDYIAGALRKVEIPILEKFENYHIIEFKPSYRNQNKVFK